METKVAQNIDQILSYDKQKYPAEDWWPKAWTKDQNLRNAFKYSALPIYREIATKVGEKRMKHYVESFDYGNKDISSGLDDFWLNGSIKISAFEQIKFLQKLRHHKLKVSEKTIKAVIEIFIYETGEDYVLRGKTGGGYLNDEETIALGWFVGYIEKGKNVWYFAMNIQGDSFRQIQKPRIKITKAIFKELRILSK